MRPVKHNFKKLQVPSKEKSTDVFIVNPWGKKRRTLDSTFPANMQMEFVVTMENVFQFDFFLDTVKLECEGARCLNYPSSVLVPAGARNYEVGIMIKPLEPGNLKVKGLKVQFLNYEHTHLCDERGFFGEENERVPINEPYYDLHQIQILEELPQVRVQINRESVPNIEVETLIFDETEVFTYQLVIENLSAKRIQHIRYDLCIESENPPIYEHRDKLPIEVDEFSMSTFVFVEQQFQALIKCEEYQNDLFNCPSDAFLIYLVVTIPNIKHPVKDMRKLTLLIYFRFDDTCEYEHEIKLLRLVRLNAQTSIQQCRFISKYQVENREVAQIKEFYDLQDSCYLSLELIKQRPEELINLSLTSPILLEGSFTELMTESNQYLQSKAITHFSKVIKLRKLTQAQLQNESTDLYIVWNNPFRNTYGLLKPLSKLSIADLKKHCCKDLFEVEATESQDQTNIRAVSYTISISEGFLWSQSLRAEVSIINDVGYNQSSQKSFMSATNKSATGQQTSFEIVQGSMAFPVKSTEASNQLLVYYPAHLPQRAHWGLKVEIFDLVNGIGYVKRGQIK